MKLEFKEETLRIESSEGFQEMEFGIRSCDVGFIMQLLRNDMYKYPIDAICREIASNARDANREVGKGDVPINISIIKNPFLDSEFAISFSDIGPGISPDRMQNIFLNYGASTKRDTDEQTGGFGLGAKTPFAYTNTFCIETVYDCKKYVYVALVKSGNKGRMYLMNEEECFDESGTTISVPIIQKDIERFEHAAYRATFFWDVRPNYLNFTTLREVNHYEEILKTDDFTVVAEQQKQKGINFVRNSKVVVLLDGIPYEIDNPDLGTYYFNSALEGLQRSNVSILILCHVNVGEVTISPNRETLQYNDKTIKQLQNRLSKVSETIRLSGLEIARKTNTIIDRLVFLGFLKSSYTDISKILSFRPFNKFTESELYLAYLGYKFSKIKDKDTVDFDLSLNGVETNVPFHEILPGLCVARISRESCGYNKHRFQLFRINVESDFFDHQLFFMDTVRKPRKDRAFYEMHKKSMLVIMPSEVYFKYPDMAPDQKKGFYQDFVKINESIAKLPEYGLGNYQLYSSLKQPKIVREKSREKKIGFPIRFYNNRVIFINVKEIKNGQVILDDDSSWDISKIIFVPLKDLRKVKEFQTNSNLNIFLTYHYLNLGKNIELFYINERHSHYFKGARSIYDIIGGLSTNDKISIANAIIIMSKSLTCVDAFKGINFISKKYSSAYKKILQAERNAQILKMHRDRLSYQFRAEMEKVSDLMESIKIMEEALSKFVLLKGSCYDSSEKKHKQEYVSFFENKLIEKGEIV